LSARSGKDDVLQVFGAGAEALVQPDQDVAGDAGDGVGECRSDRAGYARADRVRDVAGADAEHPGLVPVDIHPQFRQVVFTAYLHVGCPRRRASDAGDLGREAGPGREVEALYLDVNRRRGAEVEQESQESAGGDGRSRAGKALQQGPHRVGYLSGRTVPPVGRDQCDLD
jgi:hypothetical protein